MPQVTARFQKYDQFQNAIFIASGKYDNESYSKLKKYSAKLASRNYNTFLPVFHNPDYEYCTIRFKTLPPKMKIKKNATYCIDLTVKKQERGDKTYVNCFADVIKLIKDADPIYEGDVLDMDSESDE